MRGVKSAIIFSFLTFKFFPDTLPYLYYINYIVRNILFTKKEQPFSELLFLIPIQLIVCRFLTSKEDDLVLPCAFCGVEGAVHSSVEAFECFSFVGGGDTEACSDGFAVWQNVCFCEVSSHAVSYFLGLVDVRVRQENDEFVAAPAAGIIGRADAAFHDVGKADEYIFADAVSIGVVDMLEGVDINHDG